jgi:hypothetical protein
MMDKDEAETFAEGLYAGVQIVNSYMREKLPLIEAVLPKEETGHRDQCMKGLFLRACAWIRSLERLNHTSHLQAMVSASRGLLEIITDMILLHHDKTNESGWRMVCWAESEKLKMAEILVKYYRGLQLEVPDNYKPLEEFYDNQKQTIEQMRITLWPDKDKPTKPRHPSRWTGPYDLLKDIERADALYGNEIKNDLGMGLVEFYKTEYIKMNWQIHSGVAGFWNIPPEGISILAALALKWCADLAMLCTKIILIDFSFTTAIPDLDKQWANVKLQQGQAYLDVKERRTQYRNQ